MCLPGTIEVVREEIESEREAAPSNGLTRRATLAGAGAAALGAFLPAGAMAHSKDGHHTLNGERAARASLGSHFHHLTHVFTAGFPVYTGDPPTRSTLVTVENDGFYAQEWTFEEHTGTHMDAPGHFVADGRRVPALRPEELFAPVAVIDIAVPAGCSRFTEP